MKSRGLSPDRQLFGASGRVPGRLQAMIVRIERVVLDSELKRESQTFMQERNGNRWHGDARLDPSPDHVTRWAAGPALGLHASGKVAAGITRFRGPTVRVGGASTDMENPPRDFDIAEAVRR